MKTKLLILLSGLILLTGCNRPFSPSPTPTTFAPLFPTVITTPSPLPPTPTPIGFIPAPQATATPVPNTSAFCTDPQVSAVIASLKTAMQNSDGALLSSLVHPTRGMEVRWVRDGNPITYTAMQAQFLFETTYEAPWGDEPGSGLPKKGAFHDVIVPDLRKVLDQAYTLQCNALKPDQTNYQLSWPYPGDYYSAYFGGTDAYGHLDWRTWAIGIEYANNKPYIYALLQFFWEP